MERKLLSYVDPLRASDTPCCLRHAIIGTASYPQESWHNHISSVPVSQWRKYDWKLPDNWRKDVIGSDPDGGVS